MKQEYYNSKFVKGFIKGTRGTPFRVQFEKSDGSIRKMKCKVDLNFKPKELNEGEKRKKLPSTSCFIFDLKKQEHRSFRSDRVISLK